jgi:hypothetical protein
MRKSPYVISFVLPSSFLPPPIASTLPLIRSFLPSLLPSRSCPRTSLLPLLLTTGLTLFSLLTPSLFLATQTPRSDALQTTAKFGLFERCERTVQKPYLPPSLLGQDEVVLETGDNRLGLMMMDRPVGEVPGRNPRKSNETDLGTWYCEPFRT